MWKCFRRKRAKVAPGGMYQPRLLAMERAEGAVRGSVLVVDDTEAIRRLLRINLELEGYEVFEAAHGEAAVDQLNRLDRIDRLPDVVILDAQMTPRDGWWVLDHIRRTPTQVALPVIMATAQPVCEDRAILDQAGVDACVRKPFDPDDLLDLIAGFVREGRGFADYCR